MNLLKTALVLNASSCIFFGILFVAAGSSVNSFIGNNIIWLTPIVGAILIFNGCHLLFASKRANPMCPEILYFIAGDLAWVVASIVLISLGVVITTKLGAIVSLSVAAMVGFFAVLQVIGYKRNCVNP